MKKSKKVGLDFQKKTVIELNKDQLQRINGGKNDGRDWGGSGPAPDPTGSIVSGPAGNYSSNCDY